MAGDQLKGQSPLTGMVMCCTSISPEKRHEIAMMVQEMGAEHKYDLTSDVTHLIIGSVATNKYQYVAKERPDVKVLLPSFVEAIREAWLVDAEPDVEALEIDHRAPALFGLRICLTGFEDSAQRENLNAKVQNHGAEFHCDLTRDVVTHLIVKKPEGRKYDHALKWGNVHVVSLKWLSDTLERGMVLDESLYDPLLPVSQQGVGAWKRQLAEAVTLGKRQRQESTTNTSAAAGKRKIRRMLSAKLESQQENLWADIADAASNKAADESQQEEGQNDHSNDQNPQLDLENQDAVDAKQQTKQAGVQANNLQGNRGYTLDSQHRRTGIFSGAIVCCHGFEEKKTSILQEHLTSHGAHVVAVSELNANEIQEESFVVVPHDLPSHMVPPMPTLVEKLKRVTEWWVESCLSKKCLVNPDDDPLVKPFTKLNVKGLQDMIVSSTGFKDFDLLHLSKVVNQMGGTYDEYLKPTTTVLICKSNNSSVQKLQFAVEHGIPAVSLDWMLNSIQEGEVQPFQNYTLQPISFRNSGDEDGSRPQSKPTSSDLRSNLIHAEKFQENSPAKPGPLQTSKFVYPDNSTSQSPSQPLRELPNGNRNVPPPKPSPDKNKEQTEEPAPSEHFECFDASAPIDPHDPASRDSSSAVPSASPSTRPDNLNTSIAALLAQKEEASARRVSIPNNTNTSLARRRHGLLGRAPSGLSSASSMNDALEPLPVPTLNRSSLPAPTQSQKIGWSERHEAESIGMVKDTVSEVELGRIGRRKTRNGLR